MAIIAFYLCGTTASDHVGMETYGLKSCSSNPYS